MLRNVNFVLCLVLEVKRGFRLQSDSLREVDKLFVFKDRFENFWRIITSRVHRIPPKNWKNTSKIRNLIHHVTLNWTLSLHLEFFHFNLSSLFSIERKFQKWIFITNKLFTFTPSSIIYPMISIFIFMLCFVSRLIWFSPIQLFSSKIASKN